MSVGEGNVYYLMTKGAWEIWDTHTETHSHSHCHIHTHTLTLTHIHTQTHTHTHTHTHRYTGYGKMLRLRNFWTPEVWSLIFPLTYTFIHTHTHTHKCTHTHTLTHPNTHTHTHTHTNTQVRVMAGQTSNFFDFENLSRISGPCPNTILPRTRGADAIWL